ncbi:helix-turn-helix domain-containing protein [Paenibacillus sp. strain BS8-2]
MMDKRNMLIKLVGAFASIVLLYTAVATGVFFQKTNEISEYRMANTHREFLLQARDKIDTQITIALNLTQQLKRSTRMNQFVSEDNRDYYNVTLIHQELKTMVDSFSNFGLIFGVQRVSDDFVISSRNTSSASAYYDELNWSDYQRHQAAAYMQDGESKGALLLNSSGDSGEAVDYFSIVKKETLSSGEELVFYISFRTTAIVPSLSETEQQGFAMKSGARTVTLAGNPDVKALLLHSDEKKADTPLGYARFDEGEYTLHVVGSQVLPAAQYLYVTQNNAASAQLTGMLRDTIIIFVLLLIGGAVMIWFFAKFAYRPYSRMLQINEELKEITQQGKLSMKQTFLKDVLFGRLTKGQIEEGSEIVGLGQSRMPAAVVIIEWKNDKEYTEQMSADGLRKAAHRLRDWFGEALEGVEHELLEINVMSFPIIIFGVMPDELEALVYKLTGSIQAGPEMELIAGVGKVVDEMADLHVSYQEALQLLEFRYVQDWESVITREQLGRLVDADYYYPMDVERELIASVVRGRQEQATAIITKIIEENMAGRDLSYEVLSQFLFSLTATANRIMQQLKWKTEDVFHEGYNLYTDLLAFHSKEQLASKIAEIFEKLSGYHNQNKRSGEPVMADQLMDYIHTNYSKDLSLQDIADAFQLSPGYVGRMFKERTGENFKDYLNLCRVRAAKQLLDDTPKKIEEIAKLVGCNNAITFTRMFKKYEGISPSQYGKRSGS